MQKDIIRRLREKENLSLDELSMKTGISKSMLSHLETGDRTGTVETLKKLSAFYGVSIDYITNNSDRIGLIDDFINGLAHDGIIKKGEPIPDDIQKQILNLIKLKIKNL